ncbi:DUF5695 domain-containing protein [Demequina sp. SYSU T00039]|uniref:DUF5695 domain-containing protein n=1 Tax=Demequina lignilytica TaxID=3051663 RepID=A0AAW7M0G0_9MICO|nr:MULTISPECIES: DUF5695 domain-containing protein [unclassified Demequina]MDN4477859.1 DUF5695 domain-containing protein [Demequina sp. SYSU T00039-1]MDN4487768.1 DUF5695 domain-containing protein [Demequina sp. SYSU T00039]MDN4490849.1 DUF5695 domain-containing protein [Demequina sp. SYSU T00068]
MAPEDDAVVWEIGDLRAGFDPVRAAWTSMRSASDRHGTEFLLPVDDFEEYDGPGSRWLGTVGIEVASPAGPPAAFLTSELAAQRTVSVARDRIQVSFSPSESTSHLSVTQEYRRTAQGLRWDTLIRNDGDAAVKLARVGVPLLMNQYFRGDDTYKYEQCVLRHAAICHANSWFTWAKSSGDMPLLVLKTMGDTTIDSFDVAHDDPRWGPRSTFSESFEGLYTAYPIDSENPAFGVDGDGRTLDPGAEVTLSLLVSMQADHEATHRWLAANGGVYLETTPGMVLPVGLEAAATVYADARPDVTTDPADMALGTLESLCDGTWRLPLTLRGHGRRTLRVSVGSHESRIVFWGIEDPEAIYSQQAAFIAERQFETDPADPAFHGLLMWDLAGRQRVNAASTTDVPEWMAGGSDEIGLVSGLFLSEWNVHRPDEDQIRTLQAYCKDFIEDRLTEQPGWRVHRAVPWFSMFEPWAGNGADDVWRAFNYVHVANTYVNMYRIATLYRYDWLDAPVEWLRKAYFYARAMFAYWMFPDGVGADRFGNMGELGIALDLPAALRREGLDQEAAHLEALVTKKAMHFAGKEYPFGSEMAYDSTAFEAVYAYGKAVGDQAVMEKSARASLANRGRQPVWHLYMTDLRAHGDSQWNASYMTQLGAYALFDWALEQQHADPELLKAAYASYLAGFSIFNSGGCLSEAPENRGASGWIVVGHHGDLSGRAGGEDLLHGVVALSGESALGWFGALRCAASIVYAEEGRDAGLGCTVTATGHGVTVVPHDGLRARFFDVARGWAVVLERDAIVEVRIADDGCVLELENITADAHELALEVRAPSAGSYAVEIDGRRLDGDATMRPGWNRVTVALPTGAGATVSLRSVATAR